MLLPNVALNVSTSDPEEVRSLISRLSRLSEIGIVEAVEVQNSAIIVVYAQRFSYFVFNTKQWPAIYEYLGPQVVRAWRTELPNETEAYFDALEHYFGECEPNLRDLMYLYVEASWFVWRAHQEKFLPVLQRRAFLTPLNQVAVLHLKHIDAPDKGSLEYVLEIHGRLWRCFLAYRVKTDGEREVQEYVEAHAVGHVGF
jgi:hypothetical protein